jgi:hypothetical protein
MSYSTRRKFIKMVGGFSLVLGTHPVLGLQNSDHRMCSKKTKACPASSIGLIPGFSARDFQEPDAELWPAYFWLWNATLDSESLRAQLGDMAAHDARSVCMLPMPHAFRPDSTNNSLDPDYLTSEYLARVGEAVDEAARLGMTWWLYDEGGWPSGQALGEVVNGHPELTRRSITRERISADKPFTVPTNALGLVVEDMEPKVFQPGARWSPATPTAAAYLYWIGAGVTVDLLNPAAAARFLELTHDRYATVLSKSFGKTVKFMFTDEPAAGMPQPPTSIPWFPGIEETYAAQCGRSFLSDLPWLFVEPGNRIPVAAARARVALYDVMARRFADAYFERLKDWGRRHGLASGGHLGGEDETFGAVKYGFGHLLRQLRQMDVPGVDLIWRQLFPGREGQSNFPVAAASAAHQNGTRFAFTESFCVYGNGLTPAQMKWLTDYQYIRGINLLVVGCYPLSTRDHHMTGERPHFGPMNPLWDHLAGYHGYVARLGYTLSVGTPLIGTALYYPARDMWAWGLAAQEAVEAYETVALELLARQRPFDLIDDDLLSRGTVERNELAVGAMRYDTIVCGSVKWMHPQARRRLEEFATAGGKVLCVNHGPGCDGIPVEMPSRSTKTGSAPEVAQCATPLITLTPPCRDVRVAARHLMKQRVVVVFNEGKEAYRGSMEAASTKVAELDLMTGAITRGAVGEKRVALNLGPGETKAFLFSRARARFARPGLVTQERITIDPAEIRAVTGKQIIVGEHDFEIRSHTFENVSLVESAVWKTWLGEDYSGEVDYQFDVNLPEGWSGSRWLLETGTLEYAATVHVDRKKAGQLLWMPWRLVLPKCGPGLHTITIRVANTLANELTSDRVSRAWAGKKGPGWPSPYHKRALEFERESRGGGISLPVQLTRLAVT